MRPESLVNSSNGHCRSTVALATALHHSAIPFAWCVIPSFRARTKWLIGIVRSAPGSVSTGT